jgi:feruloyl-CoA synthase
MAAKAASRPAGAAGAWAGFAPPRVDVEKAANGGIILRSPVRPAASMRCLGDMLAHWANAAPGRVVLAERTGAPNGEGWRAVTYADAYRKVRSIAQSLLDRRLSPERPILILAENGIDHALLMLGAMEIGMPVAPLSTAVARLSRDFGKVKHALALFRPQLVYVDNPAAYEGALRAVDLAGAEMVASGAAVQGVPATPFAALVSRSPTDAVDKANTTVGPDSVAKVLLTSGSTGLPKGVINTQRMLCSNQEAMRQLWRLLEDEPPVLVDWLPWSHTFGGNFCLNMALRNGGSFYIDEGRPAPPLIGRSVANLRDVKPTLYFNVPLGFAMLLDHLEADAEFNRTFFSRLKLILYAAAALPPPLWRRLEECSRKARGEVVPLVSAWGMTETSPCVTLGHYPVDRPGIIGLPIPGTELKLEPSGDKLEMLVRGPNVTPGYWQDEARTRECFDADGFLITGDAGKLADAADPGKGVVFDGRVAENFKLSSGTFVNVGALRVAALAAAAPLLQDAVVAGHDRDDVCLLAFPNVAACRALCPDLGPDASLDAIFAHVAVREAVRAALARYSADQGTSGAIARLLLMAEPPSIDDNEITDKGYINQRAVLTKRADLVARLYEAPPHASVIVVAETAAPTAPRARQ